ncbi:MAG: thiolase domain-containing protein [Rhizobiales bacterium]|nr:thiolase domain-containing protein [Hyphomicrobiales bacterium]
MSEHVHVAGVGSTTFGAHPERTLQSLAAEAARAALADSKVAASKIGCVFIGNFVGGIMTGQELLGPIVAADLGLSGVAAIKIEAACASSSAAVRIAHDLIRSGAEEAALIIGVERLTGAPREALTSAMTAAIDQGTEGLSGLTFPGFWGLVMSRHAHLYGTTREQIAAVTVKNRKFGAKNPLAQLRKAISLEDVIGSALIADPIRKFDCCPGTDGAAAIVLTNAALARRFGSPSVRIAASILTNGPARISDYRDITTHDGTVEAARRAYEMAGIGPHGIDVAELHDCFSIAEIVDSEDLGFFAKGEGGSAVLNRSSARYARVVINASGGLLSKGHPTGATGCGQIYEIAMQLRGRHPNQVPRARWGLTHNGGGTAAAVTVHILESLST